MEFTLTMGMKELRNPPSLFLKLFSSQFLLFNFVCLIWHFQYYVKAGARFMPRFILTLCLDVPLFDFIVLYVRYASLYRRYARIIKVFPSYSLTYSFYGTTAIEAFKL